MPSDVTYASYLLRLQQVRTASQVTWVASVQSPLTGEQSSFPSVEALVAFLLREFGASEPRGTDTAPARSGDGTA